MFIYTTICFPHVHACTGFLKTQPMYFSKREHNPLYASAENMINGDTSTNNSAKNVYNNICSPEENGEYDALRALPPSRVCASGKLSALRSKGKKGYMYCLSPTDPPVPLRAVPKDPHYETVTNSQTKRPRNLLLRHGAKNKTGMPGQSKQCVLPGAQGRYEGSLNHAQIKQSPIYEIPEVSQHVKNANSSAAPLPTVWAPTLPQRGLLRKQMPLCSPLQPLAQSIGLESESGITAEDTDNQPPVTSSVGGLRAYEESQGGAVLREINEGTDNVKNSNENEKTGTTAVDLDASYAKPHEYRASPDITENYIKLEKERDMERKREEEKRKGERVGDVKPGSTPADLDAKPHKHRASSGIIRNCAKLEEDKEKEGEEKEMKEREEEEEEKAVGMQQQDEELLNSLCSSLAPYSTVNKAQNLFVGEGRDMVEAKERDAD